MDDRTWVQSIETRLKDVEARVRGRAAHDVQQDERLARLEAGRPETEPADDPGPRPTVDRLLVAATVRRTHAEARLAEARAREIEGDLPGRDVKADPTYRPEVREVDAGRTDEGDVIVGQVPHDRRPARRYEDLVARIGDLRRRAAWDDTGRVLVTTHLLDEIRVALTTEWAVAKGAE